MGEEPRKSAAKKVISYDVSGYEEFRARAGDASLSLNQKAGFPDEHRVDRSSDIFRDIAAKVPALLDNGRKLLDIGAGCGELAHHLIQETERRGQFLSLVDSPEVLAHLPDRPHLTKVAGQFPLCLNNVTKPFGPFDGILAYSVAQYVFKEGNLFAFVDAAIELLSPNGALLLGDIPNSSMRSRFLTSPSGADYHLRYHADLPRPVATFNSPHPGLIDDAVVLGLVARARGSGLQAFIVPQSVDLPMANRREDVLIRRP